MEDAGTVVNPLVPWSVCGIFITKVLRCRNIRLFAIRILLSIITNFNGVVWIIWENIDLQTRYLVQ